MLDFCGFLAALVVFISFIPKNVYIIRVMNLLGSILFVIYGFGIGALWTGVMNFGLVFVQLYHLIKLKKGNDNGGKNK